MTKNKDIMLKPGDFPVIPYNMILKEALEEMNKFNLGVVCLVNKKNILKGIITDGDIRRKLLKDQKPFSAFFVDDSIKHAAKNPKSSSPNKNIKETLKMMNKNEIWDVPIIQNKKLVGLVHLHPAMRRLIK
tara:strand:- start:2672 stop:3064 length:393 start_codon:yes stop_codon:yes gene_type:complete